PALGADFDPRNQEAAGWAEAIRPGGPAELAGLMEGGARAYAPLDVSPRTYSSKLVPVTGTPLPAGGFGPGLALYGPTDFEVEVPQGRSFEMELTVRAGQGPASDQVTLFTMDGRVLHDAPVPADGGPHMIQVAVDPGR